MTPSLIHPSSHRKDRVAARFTFTGHSQLGYPAYRDQDTRQMLIADPGGTYHIEAIGGPDPVPPGDGRWLATPGSDSPPPLPIAPITPIAPIVTVTPAKPASDNEGESA